MEIKEGTEEIFRQKSLRAFLDQMYPQVQGTDIPHLLNGVLRKLAPHCEEKFFGTAYGVETYRFLARGSSVRREQLGTSYNSDLVSVNYAQIREKERYVLRNKKTELKVANKLSIGPAKDFDLLYKPTSGYSPTKTASDIVESFFKEGYSLKEPVGLKRNKYILQKEGSFVIVESYSKGNSNNKPLFFNKISFFRKEKDKMDLVLKCDLVSFDNPFSTSTQDARLNVKAGTMGDYMSIAPVKLGKEKTLIRLSNDLKDGWEIPRSHGSPMFSELTQHFIGSIRVLSSIIQQPVPICTQGKTYDIMQVLQSIANRRYEIKPLFNEYDDLRPKEQRLTDTSNIAAYYMLMERKPDIITNVLADFSYDPFLSGLLYFFTSTLDKFPLRNYLYKYNSSGPFDNLTGFILALAHKYFSYELTEQSNILFELPSFSKRYKEEILTSKDPYKMGPYVMAELYGLSPSTENVCRLFDPEVTYRERYGDRMRKLLEHKGRSYK